MIHFQEIASYMGYLLSSLWRFFTLKLGLSILLALYGFLFGVAMNQIMLALLVLIFFDFFTGIMASYKAGIPIKSRTALRSAVKLMVYCLMVSSAHLTEMAVPGTTFLDEGMVAFLALTELISIIENAGTMGFAVPKKLLNQLQELRDEKQI